MMGRWVHIRMQTQSDRASTTPYTPQIQSTSSHTHIAGQEAAAGTGAPGDPNRTTTTVCHHRGHGDATGTPRTDTTRHPWPLRTQVWRRGGRPSTTKAAAAAAAAAVAGSVSIYRRRRRDATCAKLRRLATASLQPTSMSTSAAAAAVRAPTRATRPAGTTAAATTVGIGSPSPVVLEEEMEEATASPLVVVEATESRLLLPVEATERAFGSPMALAVVEGTASPWEAAEGIGSVSTQAAYEATENRLLQQVEATESRLLQPVEAIGRQLASPGA
jgi:hypothetical protein